jgi:hypothetical protein
MAIITTTLPVSEQYPARTMAELANDGGISLADLIRVVQQMARPLLDSMGRKGARGEFGLVQIEHQCYDGTSFAWFQGNG